MKKLTDLLDDDLKIVQKRKWIFLIPICIVVLAIVLGVIFQFTNGSPLNLGMDFAGGYTINVDVGANLSSDNTDEYRDRVAKVVKNYSENSGNDIKISQILVAGSDENKSLQVRFKTVADDEKMEEMIDEIIEAIKVECANIRPVISRNGDTVTANYNTPLNKYYIEDLKGIILSVKGASNPVFSNEEHFESVTFTYNGSLSDDDLASAVAIPDDSAAQIYTSGKVGATVSQDLLYNALSAILISLVLMLIYIAIRFEFKSGVAAIVALVHDLLIMFSFMTIFNIEFNSTFIAALITILGYSINNSIILFDRVRSNLKINPEWDEIKLANKSIAQSIVRCMNTTITTVIMIGMVALVCGIASIFNPDLYQMVTFSLPIIIGLLSGFYSAMFIAPSVWVSLGRGSKSSKKVKEVAEAKE